MSGSPGKATTNTPSPAPVCTWLRRGTSRDAAQLVRGIIANHDEQARTAHDIAAETPDRQQLPDRVRRSARPPRHSRGHPATTTTRHGADRPATGPSTGNSAAISTSAAAKTKAWTTASTSEPPVIYGIPDSGPS